MTLFLIRHGESEEGDKPDEERALTPQGVLHVNRVAEKVVRHRERPSLLFSSPLKRARETAEPYARGWDLPVQTVDWLRAMVEPSKVLDELKKLKSESIALVGHLPNLGLLLGTLVWGLPPKEIVIPKAAVALVSVTAWEPAAAKLRWMISPDLLEE